MICICTCHNSAIEKNRPKSSKIKCLPVQIDGETEQFVEEGDCLHRSVKTSVPSNEKPESEEEFVGEIDWCKDGVVNKTLQDREINSKTENKNINILTLKIPSVL